VVEVHRAIEWRQFQRRNRQMLRNTRGVTVTILIVSLSGVTLCGAKEEDTERLKAATETFAELNTKISKDIANKAVCAVVVPGLEEGRVYCRREIRPRLRIMQERELREAASVFR
jgi:hypothetical protein